MKYFITLHQHKGNAIDNALRNNGWLFRHKNVDIALFDHHINRSKPEEGRAIVSQYFQEGATIITYPHGATGAWWMDSDLHPPDKRVFANLVIGEGHKYVEEITQPHLEHYIIGWSYCPIKEFQKPEKIKKILFAPIHASLKGNKLREECMDINTRVFKSLLELPREYVIIVRHLNPLNVIGLWNNSRVRYNFAKPDGSYSDIDNCDLIISEGTFMYLSVARGKPTIGMSQHIQVRPNESDKDFKLKNWDKYKDYIAYPLDFDDAPLNDLIIEAVSKEQSDWKKLFIGNEMNGENLSNLLKELREKDISNKKIKEL